MISHVFVVYWTAKETSYEYKISTCPFTYRMLWKPFKSHSIPLLDFQAQSWFRMMLDCIFPENDTCKTLVVELRRLFQITMFLLLFSIHEFKYILKWPPQNQDGYLCILYLINNFKMDARLFKIVTVCIWQIFKYISKLPTFKKETLYWQSKEQHTK